MNFKADVIETLQRTPDAKSIRFTRPQGFNYLPGQYLLVTLGSPTNQMTRALTISSSPTEGFLEVTKRLTGHPFSNYLAYLRKGDELSINGPYGNFTFQGEHKKAGMLSGGIGITPMRSMIKYILDKNLKANIILIYSNSREDGIAFVDELAEMQRQSNCLKVIETITRPGTAWKGVTGRIDAEMIKEFIPDFSERVFYTSGPPKMVDSIVSALKELKVPKMQIKQEYFPGYE